MMNEVSELSIPERINMAWQVCDQWAEGPDRENLALILDDTQVTWSELLDSVNRVGNALLGMDIQKGDRVILRSQNCLELHYAILACMKIGAVPVPTSSLFGAKEVQHILNDTQAVAAIVHSESLSVFDQVESKLLKHLIVIGESSDQGISFAEMIKDASTELKCEDTESSDEAFMLYTSGTTSVPKGIVHAHRWLIATGEPIAKVEMELKPGDVTLSVAEVNWMYPFGCNFFYPLYCGATVGLYQGRFDPERTFGYIEKYGATHFIGNPTIFKRMLLVEEPEKRWDCSSLKMGLSSGETLPPYVFKTWKSRFDCEIYDSMGQTEIHIFCCTRPGVVKLSTMGKPFSGVPPVTVLDKDGNEVPSGEVGYLAIRGDHPGLALRYENQEEMWKSRFKKGWYLTGDMSYIDEEGFFWFVSRSDDLIKSRGYLISPKEVEDTLQEHGAVLEAAVVGKKDQILGQLVKAFIVLRPGHSPSEELGENLRQMTRKLIAPYKVPKEIEFIDSFPKTVTGKIIKRELRDKKE
ncbi:MAG: acyl-CoA synthetase [Acidobacteria bacterium]|nr:acyl-CoA synthetase [Acidobacteriota bacterium]MCZ6876665.1 acyl-CoA synthetase [Acidobacteriota bacterium]